MLVVIVESKPVFVCVNRDRQSKSCFALGLYGLNQIETGS